MVINQLDIYPKAHISSAFKLEVRLQGAYQSLKRGSYIVSDAIKLQQFRVAWKFGFNISSYLGILLATLGLGQSVVRSQIVRDNTLGRTASEISTSQGLSEILIQYQDGARNSTNLFHSFSDFNVTQGQKVYFTNPAGVTNIFARVTGIYPSNISGVLGVRGAANLFLINPKGINFQDGAKLDLQGSFVATTASGIVFANGELFSATNPQAPPILITNVPVGLQFLSNPGEILLKDVDLVQDPSEPANVTRAFIGGKVTLDNIGLRAQGGRVELGGLADAGIVKLANDNSGFNFQFPTGIARADVSLDNGAVINVRCISGDTKCLSGGNIAINASNLTIANGSKLWAGVRGSQPNFQAGDIKVDVAGKTIISGKDSSILNDVMKGAEGNAGNIYLTTGSLEVREGGKIQSSLSGKGNAGSIIQVDVRGTTTISGKDSSISNEVLEISEGNAGNIYLTTGSLEVREGGKIQSSLSGKGNAGNIIRVDVRGTTTISGKDSSISNEVLKDSEGNAGNINLTTGSLEVREGGKIQSRSSGKGNAGNIIRVDVRGTTTISGKDSSISNEVLKDAEGNAGNIYLTTGSLEVREGGKFVSSSAGKGNAGDITVHAGESVVFDGQTPDAMRTFPTSDFSSGAFARIDPLSNSQLENSLAFSRKAGNISIFAKNISVSRGAVVTTSTFGQGGAGNITLTAQENISFDGTGREVNGISGISSGAYSRILPGGGGSGGRINITAGNLLSLTDGAIVSTSSDGAGDAGNIQITASEVLLQGIGKDNISTGLFSAVKAEGTGNEGSIDIQTRRLRLEDGAIIVVSTLGRGDSGTIKIRAQEFIVLDGTNMTNGQSSGLFALKEPTASVPPEKLSSVGGILVETPSFTISNGAVLSTRTRSQGNAGSITVNANTLDITNGGQIITLTEGQGKAGDIVLNIGQNTFISGSDPSYAARAEIYKTQAIDNEKIDQFFLRNVGAVSGLFANSSKDSTGDGANIRLASPDVKLSDGARVFVDSEGKGQGGSINFQADRLVLDQASLSSETATSKGGDINVQFKDILLLQRKSQISTTAGKAGAGGDGGDIKILSTAGFIVAPTSKNNSDIKANASEGRGGEVSINLGTGKIFGMVTRSYDDLVRLLNTTDPEKLDPENLQTNDITAISRNNPTLNGSVILNELNVDPARGISAVPLSPRQPEVAEECNAVTQSRRSQLINSGQGGVTPTPNDPLMGSQLWVDKSGNEHSTLARPVKQSVLPIAQGWVRGPNRTVILTGSLSARLRPPTTLNCHVR